jgi:hypothetical protein
MDHLELARHLLDRHVRIGLFVGVDRPLVRVDLDPTHLIRPREQRLNASLHSEVVA